MQACNKIGISAISLLMFVLAHAVVASVATESVPPQTNVADDTIDVQHVMEAFRAAVITHDGPRLSSLFVADGSVWFKVIFDDSYATGLPKTAIVPKVHPANYKDLVSLLSTSTATLNPVRSHIEIKSDGAIASVYFDYVFLIDGKEASRGSETWQLVKGAAGWRIVAVTNSVLPRVP